MIDAQHGFKKDGSKIGCEQDIQDRRYLYKANEITGYSRMVPK